MAKSFGKSVIGWFVVPDGGEKDSSADDLIAKYANDPPPPPVELKGPLPQMVGGKVDFVQVYDAAGVDKEERERISKAQELLRSLPAETPVATKKQIVEASLKAFGVPTEKIIEGSVEEMHALESVHSRGAGRDSEEFSARARKKSAISKTKSPRPSKSWRTPSKHKKHAPTPPTTKSCKCSRCWKFFGQEAVAKVVRDSPKLEGTGVNTAAELTEPVHALLDLVIAAVRARVVPRCASSAPSDELRYVGVFRDQTIVLYSIDDPFLALFTVAHVFGHLCQLATGDAQRRRVAGFVTTGGVLTREQLPGEIAVYEHEAARIGRALLDEVFVVSPALDAAYAALVFRRRHLSHELLEHRRTRTCDFRELLRCPAW